jgi:hypothetical protein
MAVVAERVAAEIEGDFVVFIIGMRINKLWRPDKWLPVALAMPRMIRELTAAGAESGFLGAVSAGLTVIQYWRSFEALEAYARDPGRGHWPAWTAFNRRMRRSRGDAGIWHETYLVPAGRYETVYSGMPPTGLARASRAVPATGGRERARQRLGGGRDADEAGPGSPTS